MSDLFFVSIIIPCRNEEKFISKCLESIITNDYPKDELEVWVIDGMSEDKTREIVGEYVQQYPFIRLLDNPKKITPVALNIGIKHAKGEIIIRMDAHAEYPNDYISKCVYYSNKLKADNVGGVVNTLSENNTLTAKAISRVLSHPYGVGNSRFRIGAKEPMTVDTVPFGCFKKEIFNRIGYFNENLIRNQDNEFNHRILKNGGKIFLIPDIKSYYYARSDYKDLWRQSFSTGKWNIYTSRITFGSLSLRHFVPLGFVLCLLGSLLLSLITGWGKFVFGSILVSYLAINIYFSINIALKEELRYAPHVMISFITLHLSYGLGSLFGILTSSKFD